LGADALGAAMFSTTFSPATIDAPAAAAFAALAFFASGFSVAAAGLDAAGFGATTSFFEAAGLGVVAAGFGAAGLVFGAATFFAGAELAPFGTGNSSPGGAEPWVPEAALEENFNGSDLAENDGFGVSFFALVFFTAGFEAAGFGAAFFLS
jgi:hypothetical protein